MKALFVAAAVSALALVGPTTANATIFVFNTFMSGAQEAPPNASPAVGYTYVSFDDVLDQMFVHVEWRDLIGGPAGAAHIHARTTDPNTGIVAVAVGFPGFPAATFGSYDHTFNLLDAATYTAAFRTNFGGGTAAGSEAALLEALQTGRAYSNIHNGTFQGGEIRGFLTSAPEPSAWALMIAGFGAVGAMLRRRRIAALT
jgi:hypothetical protein